VSLLDQAVEKRLLRSLDLQFARLLADASQPAWLLAAACVSALSAGQPDSAVFQHGGAPAARHKACASSG
jgi:hypothetical protein